MGWIIGTAVVLALKFFVYAAFAEFLNRWFGKSHNKYIVSGVRLLISLLLTGLNTFLAAMFFKGAAGYGWVIPFVLAALFALLAWYIVIRIFYSSRYTPIVGKALLAGTVISVILAIVVGFLSFIGLMSSVNFC